MNLTIYIVTGLLITATLLPFSRNSHWCVRVLDFPRVQLAVVIAVVILVQLLFLELATAPKLAILAITALCFITQLVWILRYTRLWPLDHLFHSSDFTVHTIRRLPSIGSDHFPLFIQLTFTPAKNSEQDGLNADNEDREFASEIVQEQDAKQEDVPKLEA